MLAGPSQLLSRPLKAREIFDLVARRNPGMRQWRLYFLTLVGSLEFRMNTNSASASTARRDSVSERMLRLAARPLATRLLATSLLPLVISCGGGVFGKAGSDYVPPASLAASSWQVPLPANAIAPAGAPSVAHEGSTGRLAEWWAQFKDPALDALIAAAQSHGSSVVQAAASIERARADAIAAGVAASPSFEGIASGNRSAFTLGGPAALRTQWQLGVQSQWEIDLFGGLAREREARQALLAAHVALWHEARVSLAAEVANAYVNFRHCEIMLVQAGADARSRAYTARIMEAAGRAGIQSASAAALARAAATEAAGALTERRSQCDISVKGLVALTATEEPALRALLAQALPGLNRLPQPARFRIDALPARVIAQRPDIAAAERQLAAASADIGAAEADRYPRLTLSGSITPTRIAIGNAPALSLTTWSIGPALTLPLIDGGRREANVTAFRAQYAAAESAYRSKVRNAVREVEEALVRLDSAASREAYSQAAARGYRVNLAGREALQRVGLGSELDVEEARRIALGADANVVALEQERLAALISLYRAVGGGWEPENPASDR